MAPASSARPVVRTREGAVRGLWRDHVSADGSTSRAAVFLGIPYAEAPMGPLRFLAPMRRTPWEGVREAMLHGATPQRVSPWPDPFVPEPSIPGEDVLTLDVGTPDPSAGTGLPVLVWIHGGAFLAGSYASPWYGGQSFHRDRVVTVALSYRLGFDGFGWIDGAPSNRGVRDWLAALTWVQENIAAFGGDPSRVTIAGQSAGGAAVMRLLTMPAARGLFRGALALSPADMPVTVDDARAAAARVAASLAVAPDRGGFASVSERAVIAAQDAAAVLDPEDPLAGAMGVRGLPLSPVIDGDLIPSPVGAALAHGTGADVALLIGSTAHEFNGALAHVSGLEGAEPLNLLARGGVPERERAALMARAPGDDAAAVAGQALTDGLFRRHVARWAALRSSGAGARRTWAYDFRWASPVDGFAGHCLDLPFGFDILREPTAVRRTGHDAPQALADAVHGDWLALVREGRVDAPTHAEDEATVVYGAHGREVGSGYAPERALADALEALR